MLGLVLVIGGTEALAHTVMGHHVRGQSGGLLEVVLGNGRGTAQDETFRGVATHQHTQARLELRLRHQVAIGARALLRGPQRHSARDDGHAMKRFRLGRETSHHRVTGLVNRDSFLLLRVELRLALVAEHDLVIGLGKILGGKAVPTLARRRQGRLVDQVGEIRAREPRGVLGHNLEVDIGREWLALGVHAQDRPARRQLGPIDQDAAIEAAGAQQRRIQHVGTVGRGNHHDEIGAIEAIHLREQLVERLLALIVAAT